MRMGSDERDLLQRLAGRVEELEREIARLRARPERHMAATAMATALPDAGVAGRTTRRGLLQVVAGLTAAVGAAGLTGSRAALAQAPRGVDPQMAPSFIAMGASAGGDSGLTGVDASAASAGFATGVSGTGTITGVYGGSDNSVGVRGHSDYGTGVIGASDHGTGISGSSGGGIAVDGQGSVGVRGRSNAPGGAGVRGYGDGYGVQGFSQGYGAEFSGAKAPLRLVPAGTVGAPSGGSHAAGELFVDANGALFVCVSAGSPGTWKRALLV